MEMLRGERNLHNPSSAILLPDLQAGELTLADRGGKQDGPKKSHAFKAHRKYPKFVPSLRIQFTIIIQEVNTSGSRPQ